MCFVQKDGEFAWRLSAETEAKNTVGLRCKALPLSTSCALEHQGRKELLSHGAKRSVPNSQGVASSTAATHPHTHALD